MNGQAKLSLLNRRSFVVSATATMVLLPELARGEDGKQSGLERSERFKADYARLVGTAQPIEGKMVVDLPETAENGNFVPITISVESPMTEADYVRAIHLLSTANPFAHVATFHLSPANGIARVQTRMRLAKTQDVVTLAELSSGGVLITTTLVKVMIGGCN